MTSPSLAPKRILDLARYAAIPIGAACILVVIVGCWGMYHELEMIEESVTKALVSEVRSNSERTVVHLEQDLFRGRGQELSVILAESKWLKDLWDRTKRLEPIREFRAVVDDHNQIVAHTDPDRVGLVAKPYHMDTVARAKKGMLPTYIEDPALAGSKRYLDIRIPIRKHRGIAGYYVSGISTDLLTSKVLAEQSGAKITWAIVIGCAALIVSITGAVLYQLAMRASKLKQELDSAETRRLTELSLLLVGMAHEVRNPLNSIRLNLHTSEKVFLGEVSMDREEVRSMLSESVREVERVNELIRQLLGLARHERPVKEYANAHEEIVSAIQFFRATFENMRIGVHFNNQASHTWVAIDRSRMRQILVNLMTNARDAMPNGGKIEILLADEGESTYLSIADSGSGVDESIRQEIFEPFVTTRENGTGLGLSVVKSMVEQVGGIISYERSAKLGGAEFALRMPRFHPDSNQFV